MRFRRTKKYDQIEELNRKLFGKDQERDFENDVCWLAEEDGEVVGFATLRVVKDFVFLSRCGALRPGLGLQRRAIRLRLRWARRNGYSCAVTYCTKGNYKSLANLLREGFQFYDPEWAWAGRKYVYLIWEDKG